MRILHTSDWHVGRTIRGRSREAEHRGVLVEMLELVEDERVDLVLVAGDQFDTAAPSAGAERLVWGALAGFVDRGAKVVLVAGNHDNAARLDALAPLLDRGGDIIPAAHVRPAERGGTVRVATRNGDARVALVPFLSQRGIVKTADLLDSDRAQHAQAYAERVALILESLTAGFGDGQAVDLVGAHLTVVGPGRVDSQLGGGERLSQIFDYVVPPQRLPVTAQYVALGHLHQPHDVPGAAPARYSGSPLHLDFGEVASQRGVSIVDIEPGLPPQIRHVPLRSGYQLLTLKGTVEELEAQAGELGERVHVRAVVDEPARPGLAEAVRAVLPQAVDVRLVASEDSGSGEELTQAEAVASDPAELFGEYLAARGIEEKRLGGLFADLLEEWQEAHRDSAEAVG